MKKSIRITSILFFSFLFVLNNAYAQMENIDTIPFSDNSVKPKEDTTKLKVGEYNVLIVNNNDTSANHCKKKPKRKKYWAGIDIGLNGFSSFDLIGNRNGIIEYGIPELDAPVKLQLNRSWVFRWNFHEHFFKLNKKETLGFVTGLGLEWNNYEFKENVRLVTPTIEDYENIPLALGWLPPNVDTRIDTVNNYSKNRLKIFSFNVPLLLTVNPGKDKHKSIYLAIGGMVGLNMQTKMKYKVGNKKEKVKDDFHTNPFKASLLTKVGYRNFELFGTYGLTPLFETNGWNGPGWFPWSVGISSSF